ncbi:hypothetical protein B7759_06027 (plasmid) [Burkholderia glumae]|uniref:hypothetical protein n=1 Tax=Burkholderia glumae TaxID=337 RepID=UPI001BB6ED7F|nr:hypothetical protein [Burkholderia glumae]QTP37384.1 hypothetical protein B7759_06027 [Burkholderia glumae]
MKLILVLILAGIAGYIILHDGSGNGLGGITSSVTHLADSLHGGPAVSPIPRARPPAIAHLSSSPPRPAARQKPSCSASSIARGPNSTSRRTN